MSTADIERQQPPIHPERAESTEAGNADVDIAAKKAGALFQTDAAISQSTTSGSTSSLLGTVFQGPAFGITGPPDAQIATAPAHLLVAINSEIRIYDKSGVQLSQTSFGQFFGSFNTSGAGCCYDPRALFDQLHQRLILIGAQAVSASGTPDGRIFIAVSQTSDPTGNWNKYSLESGGSDSFPDFPGLGVSESAIYLTTDQIVRSSNVAEGWITVIRIAELLSGNSTLNITQFKNTGYLQTQPALTYGSSTDEFMITATVCCSGMHLLSVNTSGPPVLTDRSIPAPPFVPAPLGAAQPGTTVRISSSPSNNALNAVLSPVWRDGSLWFTRTGGDSSRTRVVVQWYELDTSSVALKQIGTIFGAGEAYFGAIAVMPDGEVNIVYSTSSESQFASAGYAHRDPTDPPNTMRVSGIYFAGLSSFTFDRWGDYNGISLDPDGGSVWGIAEFADAGDKYGTAIVQVLTSTASPPADFSLVATPLDATVVAGSSVTYTVNISASGGFSGNVNLSIEGLPAGASGNFNPGVVPGSGSAALTVTTSTGVLPGLYPLTITGASGKLSHSISANLAVNTPPPSPDFSLSISPTAATVSPGDAASFSMTASPLEGFTGAISFSCLGLPAGAACSFSANPLMLGSASQSSTLSIKTVAASASARPDRRFHDGFLIYGAFVLVISIVISRAVVLYPRRRCKQYIYLESMIVLAIVILQLSCAGPKATDGSRPPTGPSNATPSGSYAITVVGTAGSLQHVNVLTLTVR